MDSSNSSNSVDRNSGFCSKTKTFHSLRPPLLLPPQSSPLSAASYALSLQHNTSATAFIDSATGSRLSFSDFRRSVASLAYSIQSTFRLSKNDVAFVLSPNSTHIPVLYFSLLSLGVVISPANPLSTESELLRQIKLTKPVIAFATSRNFQKIPKLKHPTVLIDSPEFELMIMTNRGLELETVDVSQFDLAAIMYSSGTTGEVKGVKLTHRNFIAIIATYYAQRKERDSPAVMLYTVPLFHVFGFHWVLKSVALTETVVLMERFDLKKMLKAVEDFRVTQLVVAPPVVVAMAKGSVTRGYDLSSLEVVGSGGAPLGKDVMEAFADKFPKTILYQVSKIHEEV